MGVNNMLHMNSIKQIIKQVQQKIQQKSLVNILINSFVKKVQLSCSDMVFLSIMFYEKYSYLDIFSHFLFLYPKSLGSINKNLKKYFYLEYISALLMKKSLKKSIFLHRARKQEIDEKPQVIQYLMTSSKNDVNIFYDLRVNK